MVTGYAAFNTNLNITAKGNIKKLTVAKSLKKLCTTTGDELYKDENEDNKLSENSDNIK